MNGMKLQTTLIARQNIKQLHRSKYLKPVHTCEIKTKGMSEKQSLEGTSSIKKIKHYDHTNISMSQYNDEH